LTKLSVTYEFLPSVVTLWLMIMLHQ